MQVYVELAVLENFCMDFFLLYAAKAAVKNRASLKRLALASVLGAAFAVVIPVLGLGAVWAAAVKILSGIAICLAAGKFVHVKSFLKFTGAFLGFTAVLGGALIGIFSLAGLDYAEGQGYLVSSVPIGIPLFCALFVILGAKLLAKRLKKTSGKEVTCRIYVGQSAAEIRGFFDSGNKVYSRGAPVNVVPAEIAEKLVGEKRITEEVKIHTVTGSKTLKVFTADKLEICSGEKTETIRGVKFGVSPQRICLAVLHCDLLEELNV